MDKTPEKSSNDLRELVYRGVESDELDYKAALNWTGIDVYKRQASGCPTGEIP